MTLVLYNSFLILRLMNSRKRGVLIVVLFIFCLFLVSCSSYGSSGILNSLEKVVDTIIHFGKSVSNLRERELAALLRVILSVAIAILISLLGPKMKLPKNISVVGGIVIAILFFVFTPETMLIAMGWIGKAFFMWGPLGLAILLWYHAEKWRGALAWRIVILALGVAYYSIVSYL